MSLVYNTNISKTEYLMDLEDTGKAKQSTLLSMSSSAPSGTFQKGSKYYNSTDKKIYTAVEDNVWGTTGKDPYFGVIYQCDNDYYVWDGDNLITTDLEGYEKLVNKATNFNTINNTKYPTTKAVSDYVVKESIVRNFTDAGITKTTSSDVFSDRTNNTGLAEEILAKQFPTGTTLYGEVRNQGMPTGIGNAEIRVEILETKNNGAQVIEFTLFSVDIEPKEWSHIYFSARTEQQNPWIWIPKAVPTDDYTSNATTTVPTSKALSDGLLLKQDISNKSDDYTESSKNKYPSSFALYKGLEGVKPNAVTNSGATLPVDLTGYSLGDTFLNTTNKKLYTTKNSGDWKLNTGVTNYVTVDFQTGIANGFYYNNYRQYGIETNYSNPCKWVGNTTIKVHFKFNSSSKDNRLIISSFTGSSNTYESKYASVFINYNQLYFILSRSQQSSPSFISTTKLFNTTLSTDTEYYLQIDKTGETAVATLSINGYSNNDSATILEINSFETQDYVVNNYNHLQLLYGGAYAGGNYFDNGYIYLLDSSGEFLVPDDPTALEWNSGENLINLAQYADTTNGIMYFYCDNILFSNAPTFARLIGQPEDNTNLATSLNAKQDVSNLSQDYSETSITKYPSSKALSDGLNASFPIIVTDSGSSLPVDLTGYSVGDTFLNTSDEKIYTAGAGYVKNTNSTYTITIDVDFSTGIGSGFADGKICRYQKGTVWSGAKEYTVKFKYSVEEKVPILYIRSYGTNEDMSFIVNDKKLYYVHTKSSLTSNQILTTTISPNQEYILKVGRTSSSSDCIVQLYIGDTKIEETSFVTNFQGYNSYDYIAYGQGKFDTTYTMYYGNSLLVYLAESSDNFVGYDSNLNWDYGTDIIDKTEVADKTNGIFYIYKDSELLAINIASTFASITGSPSDNIALNTALNNKQDKNIILTNISASTWVADNTYADYGYKCVISNLTEVTTNSFAQVIFAPTEADSGNYATVAQTGNGTVTIYSKVNDSITIPNIIIMGA